MSYIDLRTRFFEKYKGDIKDPILNMLLDTIEAFQNEVQNKMLLSTYSSWTRGLTDGLFEVLRRNMFGQMFPGPSYSVAQASLRDASEADPIQLEHYHHFSLQDIEGSKVLFTPLKESWIVPSQSNDVLVSAEGDDLLLGFSILPDRILNGDDSKDVLLSIFANNVNPLILERIRCRIARLTGYTDSMIESKAFIRKSYPSSLGIWNDFFRSPFISNFIRIPATLFRKKSLIKQDDKGYWLIIQGLAKYQHELAKKLTINAFPVWNMIEKELLLENTNEDYRFYLPELNMERYETIVSGVYDMGTEPRIEYINSANILEPGYPYQYTATANQPGDSLILAVTPQPEGDLKIKFFQYDTSDLSVNISSGKPFELYMGLDERLHSVQTIVNTSRNEALNDKSRIWEYFSSLIASRNKILTREDLKNTIRTYPPFAEVSETFDIENIEFDEKVGRVKGFLTPFTEIRIPVINKDMLKNPDKVYFERELGLYIKSKTVNGNFIQVKFHPRKLERS